MTHDDDADDARPSRYSWRYGPLRLALPWVAVVVGALLALTHRDPVLVVGGIVLIVFGVVAFFVYRAMAKRGL